MLRAGESRGRTWLTRDRLQLTRHALDRLHGRGFRVQAIQAALGYGRVLHIRGAAIHVIGRREVEAHKRDGVNLMQFEGIQVVCSTDGTAILTVYRNRDFGTAPPASFARRLAPTRCPQLGPGSALFASGPRCPAGRPQGGSMIDLDQELGHLKLGCPQHHAHLTVFALLREGTPPPSYLAWMKLWPETSSA